MSFAKFSKIFLSGSLLLCSGFANSSSNELAVKTVDIQAWNVISDSLVSMVPMINGQRNDFIMSQICDLARGNKTQEQVNQELTSRKINPDSIPKEGDVLSLLVNGNKEMQQSACVAFLATSVLIPVNTSSYIQEKKTNSTTDNNKKDGKTSKSEKEPDNTSKESKSDNKSSDTTVKEFNQNQFVQDMKVRIAVAQATAQLYALIASNLANDKNKTIAELQPKINDVITNYAPEYFRTIVIFYNNIQKQNITIQGLANNGFIVSDQNQHELVQSNNLTLLRSLGVNWLGNGYIFGKEYYLNVRLIGQDKPLMKGPTTSSRKH